MMHNLAYDLFCGAGGASLGLAAAGWNPVVGFENWEPAVESHRRNGLVTVQTDLSSHDWTGHARPELVWASPPCQPFSNAGRHGGQWDPRDGMPWYLTALDELRPRLTVWENVKGLTYAKHRDYLNAIVWHMKFMGYDVEWRILCAADYGVPQARYRLICVGRRDGRTIRWPEKTHGPETDQPWVTMAEGLGWSGDIALRHPGRQFGNEPYRKPIGESPAPTLAFGKDAASSVWERPATTVQGDPRIGRPGHKDWEGDGERQFEKDAVTITSEEAAVLQGFPRDFYFAGNKGTRFKPIGNACPPRLVQAIVEANR